MRWKPMILSVLSLLVLTVGCSSSSIQHPSEVGLSDREPRSLADVLNESEAVVEVTVQTATARYDPLDRVVYTISTVRVDRVLRGRVAEGEILTMRIRGGESEGRKTSTDPDLPPFVPGTRHILFLRSYTSQRRPELNGWYLSARAHSRAEITTDGRLRLIHVEGSHALARFDGKPVSELEKAILHP